MDLAEKLMHSKDREKMRKTEDRLKKLNECLSERKQKEIKNIRNKCSRELRKLTLKHQNAKRPPGKRDIIKTYMERELVYYHPKPRYDCSQILRKNIPREPYYATSKIF